VSASTYLAAVTSYTGESIPLKTLSKRGVQTKNLLLDEYIRRFFPSCDLEGQRLIQDSIVSIYQTILDQVQNQETRVVTVEFGNFGHLEQLETRIIAGYSTPDNWSPDKHLQYDQAIVIDKRPAIDRDWTLEKSSPTLITENGNIHDAFWESHSDQNIDSREFNQTDTLNPAEYASFWKMAGARIGHITAGKIVIS
jgi:hypothetical protein